MLVTDYEQVQESEKGEEKHGLFFLQKDTKKTIKEWRRTQYKKKDRFVL